MLAISAFATIQTSRLAAVKAEYAAFVIQVKVLGKEAERKAKDKEAANIKLKERTDAEHKTTIARLGRDLKRMRDINTSRSLVPTAPAASSDPTAACFDRGQLGLALSGFERGIEALIGEGAEAVAGLDSAKAWAQAQ